MQLKVSPEDRQWGLVGDGSGEAVIDFGMDMWDMHYGSFKWMILPNLNRLCPYDNAAMGSFFGKTPEGAVAEEIWIQLHIKMAEMALLPASDPRHQEIQREIKEMGSVGAFETSAWEQKVAERQAQGEKGMRVMGFRHGV